VTATVAPPPRSAPGGVRREIVLETRGLSCGDCYADVSLRLHAGEVLGLFGLVGSGRSDVALGIIGAPPPERGELVVRGRVVRIRGPRVALAHGISLLAEDRRAQGLVPALSVRENVVLLGTVPRQRETQEVMRLGADL